MLTKKHFLVTLTCAAVTLSASAAEEVLGSVKTRYGVAVSSKSERPDGTVDYLVKLNRKVVYRDGMETCNCYFQGVEHPPFQIGDDDVLAVSTSSAAGGAPGVNLTFLILAKDGRVTKPKVYDLKGKLDATADGTVGCNNDDGFKNIQLENGRVTFTCEETYTGRRQKFKFLYENGALRVSK